MTDGLVRVELDNAYLKLTRTPLARTTTICGIASSKCFIMLCVLYIFLDLIPGFYVTRMHLDLKIPTRFIEEKDIEKTLNQMYAANALISFFGVLGLIAVGFLIMGINRRNTIIVFKSLTCLELNTLLGRLFPVFIFYTMDDNNIFRLMGIILIIDAVILSLMVVCLGKFVGECRNVRYATHNPQACYFSNIPNQPPMFVNTVSYVNYPTTYVSRV